MTLSPEQLNDLEKYAAQFFSYKEIAILLNIDIEDFVEEVTDPYTVVYEFYQRGKLISESELREQIIKLAKMGSPAAQQETLKLIRKQKLKEVTYA